MVGRNVSALRFLGIGEIDEILGCDRHICWRIDKTDSENKTQQEIER
jgi:hypothetical protein